MDADQVQFSLFILPIMFINGFSLFQVGRMRCRANKNCEKLHCFCTGPFIVLELRSLPNVTRLDLGNYSQVAGAVQAQHGQQVKVVAANRVERHLLFHYHGHIGNNLMKPY